MVLRNSLAQSEFPSPPRGRSVVDVSAYLRVMPRLPGAAVGRAAGG
jgi:hypothetical protein